MAIFPDDKNDTATLERPEPKARAERPPPPRNKTGEAQEYYVIDTTIIDPDAKPRIHEQEIIDGSKRVRRTYVFTYNALVRMPAAEALKFLHGYPGFRIFDGPDMLTDNEIFPPPVVNDIMAELSAKLPEDDYVIARFDELTTDALLLRARMRPGGELLGNATGKKAIVEFLTADSRARRQKSATKDAVGDGEADLDEE